MHHVTFCRGKKQIELCSLQREILFAYQLEFSPNTSGGDIVFQTESKSEGGSHSSSLFSCHGFVCIGVMLRLRLIMLKKCPLEKTFFIKKRRLTYNIKTMSPGFILKFHQVDCTVFIDIYTDQIFQKIWNDLNLLIYIIS